jgi:hypothetical protein
MKIFFLADVVLGFVLGNEDRLNILKNEYNKLLEKGSIYSRKLIIAANEIYKNHPQGKPTFTLCKALIKANEQLGIYKNEELIELSGDYKQKLINLEIALKNFRKIHK